jgi:hypothetical protein
VVRRVGGGEEGGEEGGGRGGRPLLGGWGGGISLRREGGLDAGSGRRMAGGEVVSRGAPALAAAQDERCEVRLAGIRAGRHASVRDANWGDGQ